MKRILFVYVVFSMILISCSSDDDVNPVMIKEDIKFEVVSTGNKAGVIYRTFNTETEVDSVDSFPYRYTYLQKEIVPDDLLKLVFVPEGFHSELEEDPLWTDYKVELKIIVGYKVVEEMIFPITKETDFVQLEHYFIKTGPNKME
ncbi:hypothetical protein [Carboxylicivirga linearis]|uniref:Lipoprotein n=1 Tax=Carboxylicivirga linearis TaxID=1628157 RepID=A0ABS5JZE4_9BACT|nr:hypothetical protein [Carboxylicivirga linearis]MBS2100268.1 hypothetical protein [Carboxylicivirga linearis]